MTSSDSTSLLVLSSSDVNKISSELSPEELESLMALVFCRISSRTNFQVPHRLALSLPHHTALIMPSTALDLGSAMKAVSVPTNPEDKGGLPASTIVFDENTGGVKAIVNARSLTAIRNAAGSVLASRMFLTKSPVTLVACGAGKQIEAHIDLHIRAFPSLTTIAIVNRTINDRVLNLQLQLQRSHPNITVHMLSSSSDSITSFHSFVNSANIICTATSSTVPLFPSEWVSSGTHLNLIGSFKPEMREIDDALVLRAGRVVVDSREACLAEAGELIGAGIGADDMVEIGELVSAEGAKDQGKIKKLQSRGDVTIFKSVGVGLQDVVITCLVVKRAEEMGIGVRIGSYDA